MTSSVLSTIRSSVPYWTSESAIRVFLLKDNMRMPRLMLGVNRKKECGGARCEGAWVRCQVRRAAVRGARHSVSRTEHLNQSTSALKPQAPKHQRKSAGVL